MANRAAVLCLTLMAMAAAEPLAATARDEQAEGQLLHDTSAGHKAAATWRSLLASALHLTGEQLVMPQSVDHADEDDEKHLQRMPRNLMAAKKKNKPKKKKKKTAKKKTTTTTTTIPGATGTGGAPLTGGIDTSGSTAPYGTCQQIAGAIMGNDWCKKGQILDGPSSSKLKIGRQSIYGSSGGMGWCQKPLVDGTMNAVAISTKYLPHGGESPKSDYCGKCMCIRVKDADRTVNKFPTPDAQQYYGKVYKGIVFDMCSECEDDHIDVLSAKPYTDVVPRDIAYSVGVWINEWNFVDCNTDCDQYFASL